MPNESLPAPGGAKRYPIFPVLVIALTLAIFGTVISLISLDLRNKIRDQMAHRHAEALYAVASTQLAEDEDELIGALKASKWRGVLGLRLFDAQGRLEEYFAALPMSGAVLSREDLFQLRERRPQSAEVKPISRFHERAQIAELFPVMADQGSTFASPGLPLLEVIIPLKKPNEPAAKYYAQFLIEGESIAQEFAVLDRRLLGFGLSAFLIGSTIIVSGLSWAFRRLERSHRLLEERTKDLLRANHELTLAAKTSAVGSVTAHLIHGLKNPLSGLQTFVANRIPPGSSGSDTEWRLAVATTQRMQNLIADVVRVLREENGLAHYEILLGELVEMLSLKMLPLAREAGVTFESQISAEGRLNNRDANLILLILENLIQNAIQATPGGKTVRLILSSMGERVLWEVHDQGPGLAPDLKDSLFTPCRSTKKGGSGIGLAISKQLAHHLGAELHLRNSTANGCVFCLAMPTSLLKAPLSSATPIS